MIPAPSRHAILANAQDLSEARSLLLLAYFEDRAEMRREAEQHERPLCRPEMERKAG